MKTSPSSPDSEATPVRTVLLAILVGGSVIGITVIGLRHPFSFTREVSDDPMIRGMISTLALCPITALLLGLALGTSRMLYAALLIVTGVFAGLMIHDVLFGHKIPEKTYQEPLMPRLLTVAVYLSPVLFAPALLATLPFLPRRRSRIARQNKNGEQGGDGDA